MLVLGLTMGMLATQNVYAYPEIAAETGVLIEQETGRVLYDKNMHQRMYPASTTKVLTAILAVERLDMEKIYIAGEEINQVPWDSSKAGHIVGESISGENLIRGLIIPSGNETACIVASLIAREETGRPDLSYAEAEKVFSDLMNKRAEELGALDSNFVNPHGYHDDDHYTTAYDMALISKEALRYDVIKKIAAEKSFKGNGAGENATPDMITKEYNWQSHNSLINSDDYFYEYATGIKTGFTNEAGDSVAASATKDSEKLISVVFNSEDPGRWVDSKELFEYGFINFDYLNVVKEGEHISEIEVEKPRLGEENKLILEASDEYIGFYSEDELSKIETKTEITSDKIVDGVLKEEVLKDEILGTFTVLFDGQEVFSGELKASRDVLQRNLGSDINYYFTQMKTNALTLKALPYWLGFIGVVGLIVSVGFFIKKNRQKNGLYFK